MKEKKPTYEAPKVITYSEDEIIELLGPHRPAHQAHAQHINNSNLNIKKTIL